MLERFIGNLKDIFKRELTFLLIFGVLAGFALIVLENKNKLPLTEGDFVFLGLLALLVALYKPRWIFFLFVASLPLENIILVSGFLPLQLRPYQFLGGILIFAVAVLFLAKRLRFEILESGWLDWFVFSLVPLSFLALINAPNRSVSLKNNLILISFVVLYFLARNFLRKERDFLKAAAFFAGSYVMVFSYGLYQVFADKVGGKSFEVMFGRPNSTFTEPDWLGIFLCFSLAVMLSFAYYFLHAGKKFSISKKYILVVLDILIVADVILVILSLSRSAWMGAAVVLAGYLFLLLPGKKNPPSEGKLKTGKVFFREALIVILLLIVSVAVVYFGKLSKFDVFDRARSAATSEQKITIVCERGSSFPQTVSSVDELARYGCRHINLEEIDMYKSQGKTVAEIFRQDPNVMTRGMIYKESWEEIKKHPLLGIGFGSITQKLGADERGAGFNESNIFLQVWAGTGFLGLAVFAAVFGYVFIQSFRRVSPICPLNRIVGCPVVKGNFERAASAFSVLGVLALLIPNLFNAGLFMGIFWLGLALTISIRETGMKPAEK